MGIFANHWLKCWSLEYDIKEEFVRALKPDDIRILDR